MQNLGLFVESEIMMEPDENNFIVNPIEWRLLFLFNK